MKNNASNRCVLKFYKVDFSFNGTKVLIDVNLEIYEKDFVAIIGPNGGGKTTLVKLALGLLQPNKGQVYLLGEEPSKSCHLAGYMPQYPTGEKGFPITVLDTVLLGTLPAGSKGIFFQRQAIEKARDALSLVGMDKLREKKMGDLSGGQIQRVLLARAIVSDPEILFLDEPMANIDISGQCKLFDLMADLNSRMTICFVTHDIGLLSQYVKSVVCVNQKVHFHKAPEITKDVAKLLMGESCPMELIAHGVPHRVLGSH